MNDIDHNFTGNMRRDDAMTLRRYIHDLMQVGIQIPSQVLLAAKRGTPEVETLRANLLAAGCVDIREEEKAA